ncbi:MAG TPA: DUF1801 domain-containing protein [Micromonosporaceae bacterium]|jgi:uncharacterized protein YdhG (YjbR/CyaY superfamily)
MATTKTAPKFSAEERAAMKERAKELKAEQDRAAGEAALLEKIAEMQPSDKKMAERLHAIVTKTAPELAPRTWYGMPAYAINDKIVCSFKPAAKFGTRYATLEFQDSAKLDDGSMWPVGFALVKLTAADEKKITALIKQAMS